MAAEPFTLAASLTLPPDTGQPNETLSCSFTGTFANATQQKLNLSTLIPHAVNFGTLGASAKTVWIEFEQPAIVGSLLTVSINGGAGIAIAPGGFLVLTNPITANNPGNVASLSLTSNAATTVRVVLLS